MILLFDIDTITIEYTFDKNYEKLKQALLKNVFTSKPNWKYNLQGYGFNSLPKIRYDVFVRRGHPPTTMRLLNNTLHADDGNLLVRLKVNTFYLIGLFISALMLLFFLVVFIAAIINAIFLASYITVIIVVFMSPILVGFATIIANSTYAQNRDKLIQNFEKLLRDNDIVFHKTNEIKENPVWLQKIKKMYSVVVK